LHWQIRNLISAKLKSELRNLKSELTSPLAFQPIFVERIWGGRRLESMFGKKLPPQKQIGESWEIVDRPEAQSVVAGGPLKDKTLHQLWTEDRSFIFGDVPNAARFPLLIKLLDARETLSLQVHPPEQIAKKLGGEPKTEFWYVAAADPGAEILLGFREPITRNQFKNALLDGTAADCVHRISVKTGDAAFLPSGRVHALSAGNLLIEIQQNSDTTYRVFDWNRVDNNGTSRELHIEQALESIDFEDVQPELSQVKGELLITNKLFEVQKWNLDEPRETAPLGQFAIVCCISGSVRCCDIDLLPGEFFLIPAQLADRKLKAVARDTTLLRVTIPVSAISAAGTAASTARHKSRSA
jgi:mannose-6-phosphate isomerase